MDMNVVMYVGAFLGLCYGFWLHFLLFAAYQGAVDSGRKIPLVAQLLLLPVLLAGATIDVLFNTIFGWILLVEWPLSGYSWKHIPSWTLTWRCSRHLNDNGWRGKFSRWLCHNLLDPFEAGGHCCQK